MSKKNEFNKTLFEMLELAGLTEEEDMDSDMDSENDSNDGELHDEWSTKINSRGDFKIEFFDNFVYVYYKNKRSQRIKIDPKLKPYKKLISNFINKIFNHIEKMS
jgi:hypothetical protein